jgi:hypothetical protein
MRRPEAVALTAAGDTEGLFLDTVEFLVWLIEQARGRAREAAL